MQNHHVHRCTRFLLLLLLEVATAQKTCVECVTSGGIYQDDDSCFENRCEIADIPCCKNLECCATQGCRDPQDTYEIFSPESPFSCESCVMSVSSTSCVRHFHDDKGKGDLYNGKENQDCNSEGFLPPCATCFKQEEEELVKLNQEVDLKSSCTKAICEEERNINYLVDPCSSTPNSCGCWCQKVNLVFDSCPHLGEEFWCSDDPDWLKKGEKEGASISKRKGCTWVSKRPNSRCEVKGKDQRTSGIACPVACNACKW